MTVTGAPRRRGVEGTSRPISPPPITVTAGAGVQRLPQPAGVREERAQGLDVGKARGARGASQGLLPVAISSAS